MGKKARPIAKKIEEIVYEVEAGQVPPWTATKRLTRLFGRWKVSDRSVQTRQDSVDKVAVPRSRLKHREAH